MKPKYIENSMMLTKEAFTKYIQDLKEQRANTYGMTIDEWNNAVLNRGVVETKSWVNTHSTQSICKKYDSSDLNA